MEYFDKEIKKLQADLLNKSLTLKQHEYAKKMYFRAVSLKKDVQNNWLSFEQAFEMYIG